MPLQSSLRITGAKVWQSRKLGWCEADVYVEDGKICEVGRVPAQAARTIRADGQWLIPGVIDPQVHFREPGNTYKEDLTSGSRACVAGGVTTFFDMPNVNPATVTADLMHARIARAAEVSRCNYAFFMGATSDNLQELIAVQHVCGIKIFMGSSTGNLLVDSQEALESIFAHTDRQRVIALHCEDETRINQRTAQLRHRTDPAVHSEVRDVEAAVIATRRALDLARRHNHRTHILHVSTGEEADLLRSRPECVTAECAPHHLLMNTQDYAVKGSLVKMNPSLKAPSDNQRIFDALKVGAIDCIATDHAPHTLEEKTRNDTWKVPAGIPAIENSLGVMLDAAARGRCTVEEVLYWMCEAPARVYHLHTKGRIEVGLDADLCIVNPSANHTVDNARQFTKSAWSPWHGQSFSAWPVTTIVAGVIAFEGGMVNEACRGRNVF